LAPPLNAIRTGLRCPGGLAAAEFLQTLKALLDEPGMMLV
jgi:hypothetical protein